jgi:hypothetical protein
MRVIERVYDAVVPFFLWLWRLWRVLWACRVPVASAIGGGLFVVFIPQALDLFADTGFYAYQWIGFFVLVFGWAWVVHAMARRALQYDDWLCESRRGETFTPARRIDLRAEFYWLALWIPRLLGIAVFIFVGWALFRARQNLQTAVEGMPEAATASNLLRVLLVITVVLAILYGGLLLFRRRLFARLEKRDVEPPLLAGNMIPLLALFLQPFKNQTKTRLRTTSWPRIGLLLAWFVVGAIFIIALVNPAAVAECLPRALFLPVLLGGGVLLLGEIGALSLRWETPLLLVLVVVGGVFALRIDHYDDMRWAAPSAQSQSAKSKVVGDDPQISFAEALRRWKYANHCDQPQTCPDPIVIAGAGGASRAAFQTATFVGALIDLGPKDDSVPYGNLRNRIFALSTVSGSSVGAVMMRAALADAAENGTPDTPPCRSSAIGYEWFGKASGTAFPASHWRDCFQQLLVGDFLSSGLIGLAYRDNFPLGNPFTGRAFWSDRAVLLEQAFERRYYRVTGKGATACTEASATGLCRRFGHHPDPKEAGAWLPLLFINGSSVSTGRRILTSDVIAADIVPSDQKDPTKTAPLIGLGYDIGELRGSSHENLPKDKNETATEMFLSTAATTSCRFPIISPQGMIRDQNGGIVDSIVDGGYFENDGLDTATDVVLALNAAGLHPIVLRIANEPFVKTHKDRELGAARPVLPEDSQRTLFDVYTSIAHGLLSTRSGHEDEEAAHLKAALDPVSFVEIGVYPLNRKSAQPMETADAPACRSTSKVKAKMKTVSMSWWMSQPVQAYLDRQLCVPDNWSKLNCLLKAKDAAAKEQCDKTNSG